MPSTKIALELSKPRMNTASPVLVLPFSPRKKVPTPGVLRSASVSVVAPWSRRTCSLITCTVCGVLTNGAVNLVLAEVSALKSAATEPSTRISGSTREGCCWAMAGAERAISVAAAAPETWGTARATACFRLLI